jgi:hypothetical protein
MYELARAIVLRTSVVAVLLLAAGLSACSGRLYGGKPFFSPDDAYVCGGEREYDVSRFAGFRLGVTTKTEVTAQLGEPLWWTSSATGASLLGYDYYVKQLPDCQFPYTTPVELEFDPQGLLVDVHYPGSEAKFPRDRSRDALLLVEGHPGPGDLYIDGIVPKAWQDQNAIYFDGYHRMELRVHAVLWGQMDERNVIVTILTATHLPMDGPEAFVKLRRDAYGIVHAIDWLPNYNGLCLKPDELTAMGLDAAAAAAALERFPCREDRSR